MARVGYAGNNRIGERRDSGLQSGNSSGQQIETNQSRARSDHDRMWRFAYQHRSKCMCGCKANKANGVIYGRLRFGV